ncbi:MAG TPA: hypothetical protein VGQ28_17590, partial [Thermoanaerobaculia bacterium]|nr:hypothetical protein [Thermoanaerobaculia bacterium]
MKRVIAGLALATAATLIAAVPAQAAAPHPTRHAAPAPDPVAAVKKYFVPGEGVRFIDRATIVNGKSHTISARHIGTYLFGRSGIAASDISGNFNIAAGDKDDSDNAFATPERTVTVGGATYLSGSVWDSLLPEGKTWMKMVKGFPGVIGVNR